MERIVYNNKEHIIGYHTQEFRCDCNSLSAPIKCLAKNAWLGIGFYFWTELEFAKFWGEDFKLKNTGSYDIYKGYLDCSNCINAVFDEKGYFFFKGKIEETIEHFKKNGKTVTLERVHRFLADNIWPDLGIEGIIYDDKPVNSWKSDRVYSEIPELYYKKRIQIVIFNTKNLSSFDLLLEDQTTS